YSPRRDPRNWSGPNLERMERLIADGRMTPAGLAVFTPDTAAVAPRYQAGEPLPSWLEEGLRANAAAHRNFLALTPVQRRDYVRWIVEAKKEETRSRRLGEAVERLERGEKIGLK
ncbi:MAG TPA: YdeI/OmpD-associated family protein, partial [Thermoanaerobaculia bacterium]|nr:YdeI/OmpD-associated family protein [Thermoanaerobaculia bacterium]